MNPLMRRRRHTQQYQEALEAAYGKWSRIAEEVRTHVEREHTPLVMYVEHCTLCTMNRKYKESLRLDVYECYIGRCICVLDQPIYYNHGCHELYAEVLDAENGDKQLEAAIKLRDLIGSYLD